MHKGKAVQIVSLYFVEKVEKENIMKKGNKEKFKTLRYYFARPTPERITYKIFYKENMSIPTQCQVMQD